MLHMLRQAYQTKGKTVKKKYSQISIIYVQFLLRDPIINPSRLFPPH